MSPSVVPVPLKETCVISETDRRLARDVRAFQVAKVTRAPSLKRKPRGLRDRLEILVVRANRHVIKI